MADLPYVQPSAALRGRVLIVDDIAVNRTMLARYVAQEGLTGVTAENGRIALDKLQAERFDLILLDVVMPELDGHELLRIAKADPRLRDIPVIMISALDEIDVVVRCITAGAEDYLPKPFNRVLLRARLAACLEKKRLRDQEILYLEQVGRVSAAAAAVERGTFDPATLDDVGERTDALGQLARVFTSMAREVRAREERLQREVQQLRIRVDAARAAEQVEEITGTDYFQVLQQKVQRLRAGKTHRPE